MKDSSQIVSKRKDGSLSIKTVNLEPTKTQQQFKDECDINNIMKKYSSTGEFTHLTSKQGIYADFSQITDYRDMVETVQYAKDAFASLPADVRARFGNDPAQLLNFVQDDKNYDEGVKLGLVQPKTPQPIKTPILNNDEPNDEKPKTKTKPKQQPLPLDE